MSSSIYDWSSLKVNIGGVEVGSISPVIVNEPIENVLPTYELKLEISKEDYLKLCKSLEV